MKYELHLWQILYFDDEEACFNELVNAIDEAEKDGFKMTKITKNQYRFTNNERKECRTLILKKVKKGKQ